MSRVRICFLGTPEFAVVCLKELIHDEHFEIVGVVTQPDRPAGRKLQLTPSPVKTLALSSGLKVISPEKINDPSVLQEIAKWGAEVAVVVAFGQILSQDFLNLFKLGAVNVHGSLLPRWRGAAPIQRALQNGDGETGVSLQKIVKQMDAGDVLGVRKVDIGPNTDAKDLFAELSQLGADLLRVELMDYVRGNLAGVAQDPALVTFAKKIEKSEAEINWNESAVKIHNKVRGFNLGPGTWTMFREHKVKIHRTQVGASPTQGAGVIQGQLVVGTGQGSLEILEIQAESRNRMKAAEFCKAFSVKPNEKFGV